MPKEKNSVKNVYVSYINVSSHLFFCSFLQQPNETEFTDCLSIWTGDKLKENPAFLGGSIM